MKIELMDVDSIKPYAGNAKKHSDEQIKRLAAHISKFGWDQPIVVDKDLVIIKGHGRKLAAIKLGLTEVPVLVRHDLNKEEANAARIGDNAVSSTEYDTNLLQEQLKSLMALPDLSFSLEEIGLGDKGMKLLMEDLSVPDLDSVMVDTSAEIARQKEEDHQAVVAADKAEVSLVKAFGFKMVTRDQERVINRFLIEAEEATGKTGADAFVSALQGRIS